ncbi:MAG TPA: UvrD-helicase domain-containing protein [Verrucomicrobiae bacterium]|jgi:superfamily I DNA/RNA helicase|nr:UvrD-helicase domain-containing protein [Verrucomicrobiae bacterium]
MLNLSSLNPAQRQAVETTEGPLLILAGAGTGKTRVITFRVARMVEKGVSPGNVLAVTFTNKAAREMRERINQLLGRRPKSDADSPAARPTICTFHSLCVRILRLHIERLGYKRNFVIYSESEQLSAIKKILSHISDKSQKVDPYAVLAMLSRYRNGGDRASAFADPNVAALAKHVQNRYETALRACNAVDFDDLILLTLKLFSEHPEVLQSCREKYKFVMVDEYQDTNAAQFKLVHHLTSAHRNLCVVGDDDQSIYGWRGAETANLLELEKHFPNVKVVKLEQNYRSTNTILSAANAVIKNNARRRGKHLWSQKGEGAKISLQTFQDDEEEARRTAEDIEFARMARRVPWRDQAILFRTNQQSRPLETALRQAGIRYHLVGGQSYFDRREIKDFLAYLKMFVNPNDDISLLRIANVPPRGLSDVTMERLLGASHERNCSVFTAMRHTDVQGEFTAKTREAIQDFVGFVERRRSSLQADQIQSLAVWAQSFLDEVGYAADIRRSEKNQDVADNRLGNLAELIATLPSTTVNPEQQLQDFLDDLSLDSDREEKKENTADAVTLITIHSCKGLEYPHVHIVGLEDGLFPHSRSKVEGTMDEERRLFYVAVTRAMQTLSLSHCSARKRYGQPLPCHPSPFLREIPAEFLETEADRAKGPANGESAKSGFAAMRMAAS